MTHTIRHSLRRWALLFVAFSLSLAPVQAWAAVKRGSLGSGAVGTAVTISAKTWTLSYTEGLLPLARMLKNNTLYLSNDDAFPALSSSAYAPLSLPPNTIVLATTTASALANIKARFALTDSHVTALNNHDQSYLITLNAKNQLLILGDSEAGARYGVTDFLANLSTHNILSASWTSVALINWPDATWRLVVDNLNGIVNKTIVLNTADYTFQQIAACDYDTTCAETAYADIGKWVDQLVKTKVNLLELVGADPEWLMVETGTYPNFVARYAEMVAYFAARHITLLPKSLGFQAAGGPRFSSALLEGLGMFDVSMTIGADDYLIPDRETYAQTYDYDANEPANLLPFSSFTEADEDTLAEVRCSLAESKATQCLYEETPASDWDIALSAGELCITQNTDPAAGADLAHITMFFSPERLRAGGYYLLSSRVKPEDNAEGLALSFVFAHSDSEYTMWTLKDLSGLETGEWQRANFIFRFPDDEDGAIDLAGYTAPYIKFFKNKAGKVCFDDFMLKELNPGLINVLENQGVRITDGDGAAYSGCTDADGDGLCDVGTADFAVTYPALPFSTYWQMLDYDEKMLADDGAFTTYAGDKAVVARIKWLDAFRPEKLLLTYSSLLPSIQGERDYFYDVTQGSYYTDIVNPVIDDVLSSYATLPPWIAVDGVSEVRRFRMGVSAGQTGRSNAEYFGYYLHKVGHYLATKRSVSSVVTDKIMSLAKTPATLRPIVWHDMFSDTYNGDENYEIYYGGQIGATATALDSLAGDPAVAIWDYRDCLPVKYAMFKDFTDRGYQSFGASTREISSGTITADDSHASMADWASFAAGYPEKMIGVAATEWYYDDRSATIAYIGETMALAWNAGWGILKYWTLDAAEQSAGAWNVAGGMLTTTDTYECDREAASDLIYDHSAVTLTGQWQSQKVALRNNWGNELKVSFFAKSKGGTAPSTPVVSLQYYDALDKPLASSRLSFPLMALLTSSYREFASSSVTVPAGAASAELVISPPTGVTMLLDDPVLSQKTATAGFP